MIPNKDGIIVSPTEPQTDRRKIWIQKGKNIIPTDFEVWEEGHYNATTGLKENLPGSTRVRLGFLIKVKSGTSYYFNSFNNECKFIVRTYDKNGRFLRSVGAIENNSATVIDSNEEYISVTIYNPSNLNFTYEDYKSLFESKMIKPFVCLNFEEDKTFEEYINHAIYVKNDDNIYEELINEDIKYKVSKVDKEDGKGLSTNDFTNSYKTKLESIATGANKTTVENVVTSTSTTNALSAAQGKALNDKINGIVLYNNANGTTGTVTLSQSATNFKVMDILYFKDGKYSSVRVYTPNGKKVVLSLKYRVNTEAHHSVAKTVLVSGTSVTLVDSCSMNVTTAKVINTSSTNDNSIYICTVMGYK